MALFGAATSKPQTIRRRETGGREDPGIPLTEGHAYAGFIEP
jgi:hypothetical protein